MGVKATTQFVIAFSEKTRRWRHDFLLKILSCLGSCRYIELRQIASQSFSEDYETDREWFVS